jgi:hypothetical protein
MKKMMMVAMVAGLASLALAAPVTTVTNYFPAYVLVQGTNTDVGTTGLATGTVYVCFAASDLAGVNTTNGAAGGAGSDVRPLMYAIVDRAYLSYTALASTNRPAQMTVSRGQEATSATNLTVQHLLKTTRVLTDSTVAGE